MSATDEPEDDDGPDIWGSFATALRLIVGWFCVAIGVLNLIAEVDSNKGAADIPYFVFHVMLLVGGLALLGLGMLGRSPGVPGYTAGGAVAGLGLLISTIPVSDSVCCMTAFAVRHGWPYTLMARDTGRWHIDSQHLLADLLFWGYTGLLVLVVVSLFRPREYDEDEEQERLNLDAQHGRHEAQGQHEPLGDRQAPA